MGQYVQEGRRDLIETVLQVKKPRVELMIKEDPENID
jgi:glucose-6-phosphate isomerase